MCLGSRDLDPNLGDTSASHGKVAGVPCTGVKWWHLKQLWDSRGSLGVLCPTSSSQHPLLQGAAGSGWTYRYSLSARLWEALPGPRSLLAPPAHLNLGATCREWEGAAGEAEDGGGGGRKRMEMEKEGSSPADHWRTEVSAVVVVSCFYFYSLYVFPISKFHLKKKKKRALPGISFMPRSQPACVLQGLH